MCEDDEIRSRSPLAKFESLQPWLHRLARWQRRASRLLIGGYFDRISPELIEALGRYRIAGEQR
jgi:hypothetical protein